MLSMFGVQCPDFLEKGTFKYYESFEDSTDNSVTSEVPAFCGRYSKKNENNLFKETSYPNSVAISQKPFVSVTAICV